MRIRPSYLRIRSVGAAGDIELPSGANGLQARQGVQDFRRAVRGFILRHQLFPSNPVSLFISGRKSKTPPALAAQPRAFSVISSSLRAKLSTSRNHSTGKVSAIADVVSNRSHPLTGYQRYCGRRQSPSAPSTSAMSVRERLVPPRFTGLAAREARLATPYEQDRHGLHSANAPLRPHQTCGKEVRLRLVSFDARFILSGSVVNYVPDTSSEGERRRETETAGVPLRSTPSLTDSLSGIATLPLRSCRAGPIRSRDFSFSVAATGLSRGFSSLRLGRFKTKF